MENNIETHFEPKKRSFFKFKLPNFKRFNLKMPNFRWKLFFKIVGILLLILVVVLSIVGFIYGRPAYEIYKASKDLNDSAYGLKQSLKSQDLEQIKLNLETFEGDYEEFKQVYSEKSPRLKSLPIVKNYVTDVDYLMNASDSGIELGFLFIETLDPYAEELGLREGSQALTNEEKIKRIANVLPKISDEVDEISALLIEIDSELQKIDSTKYPEEFRGTKVREQIVSLQTVFNQLAEKSPKFKGLFEQLPVLIGVDEPKTYLVLMANSLELRMGGGFTTFGVVVEVEDGIPTIVRSVDTYFIDVDHHSLDNRNVPYFLRDYLRVNRLYARDALSTSPDFKEGADLFINRYWDPHPGFGAAGVLPEVDGVVQVNTHLAQDLLEVLGPVDVRGRSFLTDQGTYKGFSDTEFNSENVLYNLEIIANSDLSEIQGRKDIIKFLLESILNKVLNAQAENLIPLTSTLLEALGSKDVMVYVFEEDVQRALEDLNYAGRVRSVPNQSWDYLYILHSNFGGGKRDWIVTRETNKRVYKNNGKNYSELEIKITNPKAPDWWEPSWLYEYPDYIRVYVPRGSQLVNASASDGQEVNDAEFESEEFNKDYFEFFVRVPEGKVLTLNVEYILPDAVNLDDYNLLLQKQSGTHGDLYSVIKGDTEKRFTLNSDMEINFE